jgi:hypothetical protein
MAACSAATLALPAPQVKAPQVAALALPVAFETLTDDRSMPKRFGDGDCCAVQRSGGLLVVAAGPATTQTSRAPGRPLHLLPPAVVHVTGCSATARCARRSLRCRRNAGRR